MADSSGSQLGSVSELAKNPWVLVLAAVLGGGGSGMLFGRPDPFTGTEGRALTERVIQLERGQALDDQHRIDAVEGYQRIRVLEVAIARQTQATVDMREEVKILRRDLTEFLRRLVVQEGKG